MKSLLRIFHLIAFACVLALGFVLGQPAAYAAPGGSLGTKASNNAKVVTVGYYYSKNFQEGVADSVLKSGYGYEYLQQISDYTGWQYKYIYGDWNTIYTMFVKGEIDLMAGLAYRDDRTSLMEYPDYYLDVEHHYIFVNRNDVSMSEENLETLNGKRIGCVRNNNLTEGLKKWAAEKGVTLDYVEYDDIGFLPAALLRGDVDGIVANEKKVDQFKSIKPLILYDSPKSYICVRKGAARLLDELNEALTRIDTDDRSFVHDIWDKYYTNKASNEKISQKEREWIVSHKILTVGYTSNYLPFCTMGHDGHVDGVLGDILEMWLQKMGLENRMTFRYKGYPTHKKIAEALNSGEVDIIFPVPNSKWFAEQYGVTISHDVVDVPMSVIYKGEFSDSTLNRISVTTRPVQSLYAWENFPKSELVKVRDGRQCLKAVQDDRATSTIMTTFRVTPLLKEVEFDNLKIMPLGERMAYAMGVRKGDYILLSLLNRGITMLDYSTINNAMYGYAEKSTPYSLSRAVYDNLLVVSLIIGLVVFVIIAIFVLYISGMKKAQREVQNQKEIAEALSLDYPYAILVDVEKGFSITIKIDGRVLKEKERIYHESYDGAWKYFANRYICDDDRDAVLSASTLDVVAEKLKESPEYTITYRAQWDGREHYAQSSYTKIYLSSLKKNVIILGCKTVDEIVAKERERRELMANALAVAEHSNQSKTIFLNNMSHDIRTPMNAIIGFTNLAKSHTEDAEAVRGYLGKISVASGHLLSLINNVLDMSRIESGKVKLAEERVHLPSLMREVQDIVQNTAQSKGVSISFYDALSNEVVLADDLKLKQVLLNIVGNAIKFTLPGGKVVVSVVERGGAPEGYTNYQFTIADTGIGMSSDFRDHIFEAFSREKSSTVSGIQGSGLGMAISKNIIDMMGGTIAVDSTPNVGTKITVQLSLRFGDSVVKVNPVEELHKDPAESLFSRQEFDFKGKRVLLVEDNQLNQEIAESILQELGCIVDVASDGNEAVEKVRESAAGTYNIILMDIQMPNLDGYGAAREIRKMADSAKALIPIVALTANAFDEDRQKAFEAGMNGHVTKPIAVTELMEMMGKLL